jgi:hypothetical protein
MKNLKYIKLFEAFESIKLSKTLGFISKDARNTFISQLKQLADKMDFPYSKYSDDYFQYLPFKKALDLNRTIEDAPCDATSRGEFPQYSVEGETCQGGRLKRRWGAGIRSVVCPVCNGTGVKPKKYNEVKWIKFWFNKDGKYVLTTGTDGKSRDQVSSTNSPDVSHIIATSQEISDYKEIGVIRRTSDFRNHSNGSFIYIRVDNKTLIGRLWNDNGGSFIIQNGGADGSKPDYSNGWERYGVNSWNVSSGDYSSTVIPKILLPKDMDETVDEENVDPYTWNASIELRNLSVQNYSDMKTRLSEAHFAIVLDYLELKKSEFKSKRQISSEREESRQGATALLSDDDIKRINIRKYAEELAKRIQITPELTNIGSLIFRFFGQSKFGYYVLRGRHFGDFNSLITYIYRFLEPTTLEGDKEDYQDTIIQYIKGKSEINGEFNINAEKSLKNGFKNTSTEKKKLLPKLEELNKAIYDRFKSFEIESIDDIELFYSKMESVRKIWRESDRFSNTRKLFYLIENMTDENRVERYLNDISDSQVESMIIDIDRFIKIINKV